MKQLIFNIAVILIGNIALSQTADQVFEQYLETKKSEKEYQVLADYALYKGIDGTKVYESYSGLHAKYNGITYQKLGEMELAQGADFVMKLNTTEKAMLVGLSSKPVYQDFGQVDTSNVLQLFEKRELEDLGTLWKLTLISKGTILNQFSKMVLMLTKKELKLTKHIMIYASISDFSMYDTTKKEAELDVARLEINYTSYKSPINIDKELFEKGRYFSYSDNKIEASNKYKGFDILLAN